MDSSASAAFGTLSSLPDHCQPQNDLLTTISAATSICMPTPMAMISTVLGGCSIMAWLCSQLPQVIKNYKLRSVAGLSPLFLSWWFLGDASNLVGGLLTGQARWQTILASYYVFIDSVLVWQWYYYAYLGHGNPIGRGYLKVKSADGGDDDGDENGDVEDRLECKACKLDIGHALASRNPTDDFIMPSPAGMTTVNGSPLTLPTAGSSLVADSTSPPRSYGSFMTDRPVVRRPSGSTGPAGGSFFTRTALVLSMVLCLASRGMSSPIGSSSTSSGTPYAGVDFGPAPLATSSTIEIVGAVISWISTVSYLSSRIPQIREIYELKSTAGLSIALFAAAFCGNLFYSSSLVTNPRAWHSFGPHGSAIGDASSPFGILFPSSSPHASAPGWVGPEGSDRAKWLRQALPFLLGSAGVLMMDAVIGLQFWYYRSAGPVCISSGPHQGQQAVAVAILDSSPTVPFVWPRLDKLIVCPKCQSRQWIGPGGPVANPPAGRRTIPGSHIINDDPTSGANFISVSPLTHPPVEPRRSRQPTPGSRLYTSTHQDEFGPDDEADDGLPPSSLLKKTKPLRVRELTGYLPGFFPKVPQSWSSPAGPSVWGWFGRRRERDPVSPDSDTEETAFANTSVQGATPPSR